MEAQLNNGVMMPSPGFGTGAIRGWQIDSGDVAEVVTEAIQVGYRHLDTASFYGNERSVGRAVKAGGVERDKLFVARVGRNAIAVPPSWRLAQGACARQRGSAILPGGSTSDCHSVLYRNFLSIW